MTLLSDFFTYSDAIRSQYDNAEHTNIANIENNLHDVENRWYVDYFLHLVHAQSNTMFSDRVSGAYIKLYSYPSIC